MIYMNSQISLDLDSHFNICEILILASSLKSYFKKSLTSYSSISLSI